MEHILFKGRKHMEKMQTMPGHKGNANKKQTKIPLHC
jgi:hypothetical protein